MSPAGLTVLADNAEPREDFDMAMLATDIKDAEEDVADAKDDAERDKLRAAPRAIEVVAGGAWRRHNATDCG